MQIVQAAGLFRKYKIIKMKSVRVQRGKMEQVLDKPTPCGFMTFLEKTSSLQRPTIVCVGLELG